MISLTLHYLLPAIIALLAWFFTGWRNSLKAAPAAYRSVIDREMPSLEAQAASAWTSDRYSGFRSGGFDMEPYVGKYESLDDYNKRLLEWRKNKILGSTKSRDAYVAAWVIEHKSDSSNYAAAKAKAVGKKCIKRGPFSYFLTPGWNTKIRCNWYPVEVNVKAIQDGADHTLRKLQEINGEEYAIVPLTEYQGLLEDSKALERSFTVPTTSLSLPDQAPAKAVELIKA